MKFHLILAFALCTLSVDSANCLEGLFRQSGPCFPAKDPPPGCNTTLVESFQPSVQTAGGSDPNTFVYLFTPESPDEAEQLHRCGGRLPPGTTYDPEADLEVIIHGWIDSTCRSAWSRECKEQYLARGKYNVILVDWSWGNGPDITVAAHNVKIIGEQIAFVINNIMNQTGIGPDKIHIIGHSLGAFAAGYIGRIIKNIRRITGLDPFYQNSFDPPEKRLTYRDANDVDIIHTNGGECFATRSGDIRQLGHADFYPNGGTYQISSAYSMMEAFAKGDLFVAIACLWPRLCYHLYATQLYKVSINPGNCQFVGRESESYEEFLLTKLTDNYEWAVMGLDYEKYRSTNDTNRRKYYLKTSYRCPYNDDSYLAGKEFPFDPACKE